MGIESSKSGWWALEMPLKKLTESTQLNRKEQLFLNSAEKKISGRLFHSKEVKSAKCFYRDETWWFMMKHLVQGRSRVLVWIPFQVERLGLPHLHWAHGFWQIWAAPTPQAMEHPVRPNFLSKSTRPSRPMLPQEWLLLALAMVTGDRWSHGLAMV